MKYLPQNTLAYYNAAPQVHRHDLSEMPTSVFSSATKTYRKTCNQVSPDDEAFSFYAANHCASLVKKSFTPNEVLPAWAEKVMSSYTTLCMTQGTRMLHYILSICTREMRHLHYTMVGDAFWNKMVAQYGGESKSYITSLCSLNETAAVSRYMENPPSMSIGQYIGALSYAFHKGKWSSGYGGKKWGIVADAAVAMLNGKTSMEMLVDTGYTLAHNGGPIFNKGMMYTSYSSLFVMLLDVQRSGQIPELLLDTSQSYAGLNKPTEAKDIVKLVAGARPKEFRGWVDWYLVESLGAVGKYDAQKKKQMVLHPVAQKAKKQPEKMLHGVKIKVVGEWQVYPGQTVQVYERVA